MDSIVENFLRIKTTNHSEIQSFIKRYFYNLGYYSRTEKEVWRNRKGRIDVFAQKGNRTIGIEVDHGSIRLNSIEKLNALKPSLAVFVLKGPKFNWKKTYSRFKYLRVETLVVHLRTGQYKWIYPNNLYKISESASSNERKLSTWPNIDSKNLNGAKNRPDSGSAKPISKS